MFRRVALVSLLLLPSPAGATPADPPSLLRSYGETSRIALISAAERGDAAAVRALLEAGQDVNAVSVDGSTALHAAVHADRLDIADAPARGGRQAHRRRSLRRHAALARCLNGNAAMIAPPARRRRRSEHRRSRRRDGVDDRGAHRRPAALRAAARARRARGRAGTGVRADGTDDCRPRGPPRPRWRCCSTPVPSANAQTRKGPTPAFVPPCKGTGCGSEGVGINRGGLPDRGRRVRKRRAA